MFSETRVDKNSLLGKQCMTSGWKTVFPQLMEGTVEMKLQLAK